MFLKRRAWSLIERISFKSVRGWYFVGVLFFSPDLAALLTWLRVYYWLSFKKGTQAALVGDS